MREQTLLEPGDWTSALTHVDGPQLVVGGPGSGKTEFLVQRALHLISERDIAPERLLMLSFSRRGAADLRQRISLALGRSISQLPASTFHSLAMRIIEAHGGSGDWHSVPTLLTGPEQVAVVAEVLSREPPDAWPQPFRGLLKEAAFADEVADFTLRAAERLMDGTALERLNRADWRALPAFLDRYRAALIERGRIDYGTLQAEAVALLDRAEVAAAVQREIEYVLVDEYQDTTVAQAAIVKQVAGAGNITVAGDPYQSIYSFRGAELSNIAEFPAQFPTATGEPATRYVLTSSFRVPEAILDAAVRVTAGAGLPGAAGPMRPARTGGAVETYAFDQHSNEAEWIAAEVQRIHLRDRVPYSRIGVLVRSKRRFLPELSRALERRRIPHDRPDARLVDHPAIRPVLDLVRVVSRTGPERAAALRRVLLGPLGGLTLSTARSIERTAGTGGLDGVLEDPLVPSQIVELVQDPSWATRVSAADGFWHVWNTLDPYVEIATDESRSEDRRAVASLSQALSRLADRDPHATLDQYARMSETEDFEATPLLEYRGDPDRLVLTTLHQSKGMTFDVVFIADAREGVLPDLRTRDSLLGTRHLSSAHTGDDQAYAAFRLQEEMRLAYSAMCRASGRVVWTCTATGFETGEGIPSRFLPLVAGTSMAEASHPPTQWHQPTTPLEAEAWLRRRMSDPKRALVDRLAAVTALTTAAEWRPRSPTEFAGTLERGPDTGLVGPDPVLSASQADSYMQCPRRYAFERRLRVDAGGSVYQELGSLIHAALERAETSAAHNGEPHATANMAVEELDELFDPAVFGGGAWAEAWRTRAHDIVTRLYELWPGSGAGEEFEFTFDLTLDGTRWVGKIDRIESREDGLHIVDYKTGTTVPTTATAASSLQLGLYFLGLNEHDDRPVAGAEFWYPAHNREKAKSVTVRRLDPVELDTVKSRLSEAADGITSERWEPVVGGHCERCPVRIVCPEWPEGREAYVS